MHEAQFDQRRFNLRPFKGHASPYGNRVIARTLEEQLRTLPPIEAAAAGLELP